MIVVVCNEPVVEADVTTVQHVVKYGCVNAHHLKQSADWPVCPLFLLSTGRVCKDEASGIQCMLHFKKNRTWGIEHALPLVATVTGRGSVCSMMIHYMPCDAPPAYHPVFPCADWRAARTKRSS